jgi:hypothetical protein
VRVAEAGRGSPDPCPVSGVGEVRCFGHHGAISRIWMGRQSRIIYGLESHELPDGPSAGGPIDTNPFGILAEPGGILVADAGGNSLLGVAPTARSALPITESRRVWAKCRRSRPEAGRLESGKTAGPDPVIGRAGRLRQY